MSSARFSILVNGSPNGYFWSSRGFRKGDPLSPLLFVIVAEALHVLVEKTKQVRLLTDYSIEHSSVEVNHLKFADDTIVFCGSTIDEVDSLKVILRWFELMSRLKINYDKSEMVGIRTDANMLNAMTNAFGCKIGTLPIMYLGLPLCMGLPKRRMWDPVVEGIERKLSSWKRKYLSLGARLTLIKSVLSSIPIYFLPCFKCLKAVVKRIDKLRCEFLWNDTVEKRKFHLVRWDIVCQPDACGGLGIQSLALMNEALLGKWLWRLGESSQGLWRRIIVDKYMVDNKEG